MSKIKEAAMMRLKDRTARLLRLLELEAPEAILVQGCWLIAEAGQLLSPDLWLAHVKEDMITEQKRLLSMCGEPGCERDVAWRPSATSGPPPGPFHMDSCLEHAKAAEEEMADEDREDEEPWLGDPAEEGVS